MITKVRNPRSGDSPSWVLTTLLGSAARAKLLSHFVLHPGEEFHVRELERILGEPAGNLLRDLRRLRAIRLLDARPVGNQVRYALDRRHPLYGDLQRLVMRTSAPGAVLTKALSSLKGITLAFLYGSFAKGEADTQSDLDLMVVGEVSDRILAPAIAKVERELGRQVSYTHYTREEAKKRVRERDSFLRSVFAGPKIVFVGRDDDGLFRLTGG